MKKKTIALLLVLMLVFGVTCGGTIAYLTSTTDTITNTFTVGKVGITMVESLVTPYGELAKYEGEGADQKIVALTDEEMQAEDFEQTTVNGNKYKLIPGHTYVKDPTITVDADSENAWLFVKLENGLSAIEADTKITDQMKAKWTQVADNVYAYNDEVEAGKDYVVFSSFTLTDDADVAKYSEATIKITAYAVQADGFETATEAWDAAPSTWTE